MNITAVIIAAVIVGGTGLFIGVFLGLAGKKFAVEVDEREEAILGVLPGNNCGGCGYAGCSGLAAAIAKGEAEVGSCPVGGAPVAAKIGDTAAIPMSSMYGAFTSAREIRSRKWTPYSHPCTSKESTFRMSTAERRRMLTQHFRQKSKRQTMHSASAHGNWQNAFRIPQRIWLQQKSS